MTRAAAVTLLLAIVLAACGAQGSSGATGTPTSATSVAATPSAAASPVATPSQAAATPAPVAEIGPRVITLVPDLVVRDEPSTAGTRLGSLPAGEVAFVVDGPVTADGHEWYRVASDSPCPERNDERFHCSWWMGWVAGTAEDGSPSLEPTSDACPAGALDVGTYLGMTALHRLSCFGDDTWTLRAYMAPVGGDRGGTSIFSTEPAWLDAWGTVIFPQSEEREDDGGNDLFMYAHPDLGCDFGGRNPVCAFASFLGQWIEIQGHLDDPAARTCVPVYNPLWIDTLEEPLPPLPDVAETALRCRSLFVATSVRAAP